MEVLVILACVGFAAYFFADSDANRKRAAENTKKTEDEKRQEAYEVSRAATRDLLDRIYADHSADMRSTQRDIDELNSWLRDAEDRLNAVNKPPA